MSLKRSTLLAEEQQMEKLIGGVGGGTCMREEWPGTAAEHRRRRPKAHAKFLVTMLAAAKD